MIGNARGRPRPHYKQRLGTRLLFRTTWLFSVNGFKLSKSLSRQRDRKRMPQGFIRVPVDPASLMNVLRIFLVYPEPVPTVAALSVVAAVEELQRTKADYWVQHASTPHFGAAKAMNEVQQAFQMEECNGRLLAAASMLQTPSKAENIN